MTAIGLDFPPDDSAGPVDWGDFYPEPEDIADPVIHHMEKIYSFLKQMNVPPDKIAPGYENSILRDALRQVEVKVGPGNDDRFIPFEKQDNILTREAIKGFFFHLIKSVSSTWEGKAESIVQYCTDQVCNPLPYSLLETEEEKLASRKKIFGILTLLQKPAAILPFIQERVSDLDLPIRLATRPLGSPSKAGIVECQRGRKISCFSDWDYSDVRAFEQYQWQIFGLRNDIPAEPFPKVNLRREIRQAMELKDFSTRSFLPESRLKQLISESTVTRTLERYQSYSKTNISELVTFVCSGAMRIFAILVWGDRENLIEQFYQNGFKDDLLPIKVTFYNDEDWAVESLAARPINSGAINATFSSWTESAVDSFCDLHQWLFLAPVFRENKFRYQFHEQCRLPFLNLGTQEESNFSLVQEWNIHPDHIQTDSTVV
jgi:hypothetical protein